MDPWAPLSYIVDNLMAKKTIGKWSWDLLLEPEITSPIEEQKGSLKAQLSPVQEYTVELRCYRLGYNIFTEKII